MTSFTRVAALLCPLVVAHSFYVTDSTAATQSESMSTWSFNRALTTGIDGRQWNTPFPGATTVDAVHRAVLIRFPGSAEQIQQKLSTGLTIEKAEVVLDYDGYEISPQGYTARVDLGQQKWSSDPPSWHISAWPLRRPWISDSARGPTFNAYIAGAGYWTRFGATDLKRDRFDVLLRAIELSQARPEGRIDITRLLNDPVLAPERGERLMWLDEKGLMLKKLEVFDMRYRDVIDPQYEWRVPTGGHGLKFKNARLVITFKASDGDRPPESALQLPRSTDTKTLVSRLQASGNGGKPTAVLPSREDFNQLAKTIIYQQRARLTAPQLQRVDALIKLGGDRISPWVKALEASDYPQYQAMVQGVLAIPPRYQLGWGVHDDLLLWYLYRSVLPQNVQDHMKDYWRAWLMPDVPTSELLHPNSKDAALHWEQTGDWRGRSSFFRDGYNYSITTQNFHHTAAMGALLGGNMIGSNYAMADGRNGLEQYPLRLWTARDGTTQEMLDHYYLSITLSGQKMMADFAPAGVDRLMARIAVDRTIDLLASAYHPSLKRIVAPSQRAHLSGVLVEQPGLYTVLHTLSNKGTLNYLDQPFDAKAHGMLIWGSSGHVPPGRVAVQTLAGKWASDWISEVLDNKHFPFEEIATDTMHGNFTPPLWRRTYLGQSYGLASQDFKGGTVDVIAQWNHRGEPARRMEDIGTLTMRYLINELDMATTHNGVMPYSGGMATFQHKNRAIVCTKPHSEKEKTIALAGARGLTSLASVIALWNFRTPVDWDIYVDGRQITQLPTMLRAGQAITIRDGVTYIGIIALPATDLGRINEVVIGQGGAGKTEPSGAIITPALTIVSYNFQRDLANSTDLDWPKITGATIGGFVIELGDAAEYGDFSNFVSRIQSNRLTTRWEPDKKLFNIEYRSGSDVLAVGCATDYRQTAPGFPVTPGQHTKALPYRRVNGAWPYLPPGVDRDTPVAQQGTTGRLEKNGAVLTTEAGHAAYLQADSYNGVYTAYNLLPDPTMWALSLPGAVALKAVGRVGLLRVIVELTEKRITIDHELKATQNSAVIAQQLLITGFKQFPRIDVNGKRLASPPLQKVSPQGEIAYVVPLK